MNESRPQSPRTQAEGGRKNLREMCLVIKAGPKSNFSERIVSVHQCLERPEGAPSRGVGVDGATLDFIKKAACPLPFVGCQILLCNVLDVASGVEQCPHGFDFDLV